MNRDDEAISKRGSSVQL